MTHSHFHNARTMIWKSNQQCINFSPFAHVTVAKPSDAKSHILAKVPIQFVKLVYLIIFSRSDEMLIVYIFQNENYRFFNTKIVIKYESKQNVMTLRSEGLELIQATFCRICIDVNPTEFNKYVSICDYESHWLYFQFVFYLKLINK